MQQDIEAAMAVRLEKDDEIRGILNTAFLVDKEDQNPAYKAIAIEASEMCGKLINVLLSLRKPGEHRNYSAVLDLTVGLSANPFWLKHAGTLMPLLHTAIQAQADYAFLMADKLAEPLNSADDPILHQTRLSIIEVPIMVCFILGGSELMAAMSLPLKRKLAQYLE